LNAILKYPWPYSEGDKKWGTYDSEQDVFDWRREEVPIAEREKTLEAQIMDWADDITYAVHDLDDFYRAGFIPMRALTETRVDDMDFLLRRVRDKWRDKLDEEQLRIAANGIHLFPAPLQYTGAKSERVRLHNYTSTAIDDTSMRHRLMMRDYRFFTKHGYRLTSFRR
jgi:dGTPase